MYEMYITWVQVGKLPVRSGSVTSEVGAMLRLVMGTQSVAAIRAGGEDGKIARGKLGSGLREKRQRGFICSLNRTVADS